MSISPTARSRLKRALAPLGAGPARGVTVLIYHRVGGATGEELDCPAAAFAAQMRWLAARCEVVSLDAALDGLARSDDCPKVVLTFDDGFADLAETAWPVLAECDLPFTVYLATGFLGGHLEWEGSTATAPPAPALTWARAKALAADPRCTVGNHTHTHAPPEGLTAAELDAATTEIERHLGVTPRHFAYPWGVAVTAAEPELRARFRSAATAELGRNRPGVDFARLRRVPVRASDSPAFFRAKVAGGLAAERAYAGLVAGAKAIGARA
jgi:peptidoglycan/xylan/chitin deacetylase (PgdA/CDA1 family)